MYTVIWTENFLKQAKRQGRSNDEMVSIVSTLADDPTAGNIMKDTGGARKLRHMGRGGGKSGGYRSIHYFCGDDVPIFLLAIYGKDRKANLSKAERNKLAMVLPKIADAYKANGCRPNTFR